MLEEWVSVPLAFNLNSPLMFFGGFGMPVLLSNLLSALGFLFAGIFVYLYSKKYYGEREVPQCWNYFYIGLFSVAILQILEVFTMYSWIYGSIYFMFFIIYQSITVSVLLYAMYLLFKGIS